MFDLSINNKRESGEPETRKQNAAKFMESLKQNMIICPAIMTKMSREMRNQMNGNNPLK